jgi:beta-N-acetylhexosaminidase
VKNLSISRPRSKLTPLLAILLGGVAGCGGGAPVPVPGPVGGPDAVEAEVPGGAAEELDESAEEGLEMEPDPEPGVAGEGGRLMGAAFDARPLARSASSRGWAERQLASLSVRQKAAQLMMPWILGDFAPEGSAGAERVLRMVRDQEVGGVIVSAGSPTEVAVKLNALQGSARVPLLVGADLETGAGFRFRAPVSLPGLIELGGASDFPPLMAIGASDDARFAYEMGRITAIEARALGVHLPFAPVLDVNNNPDNPVINVRSFGENPEAVARLGGAFVRGMQEWGALATGKHFPGHGDTRVDSHLDLPVIPMNRARMDAVELVPFRAAVDAGMGAIMTAHLAVPEVTGGADIPATLSAPVLTTLLREELGFRGLVVTDALDMAAIDRRFPRGEAAVRALEAGADLLLMPPDVGAAIDAIERAVRGGRLTEERLDRSVLHILRVKEAMGLHQRPEVEITEIPRRVGIPAHQAVVREIAEGSLTLLRNERGLLPLRGTRTANVTSISVRRANDLLAGRTFNARLRQTYPRLREETMDRGATAGAWEELLQRVRSSDLVILQLHLPAGGTTPPELPRFVERLREVGVSHLVVAFGDPYVIREFPEVQGYLVAWGSQEAAQRAAVRGILGEIPIRGRSPIAIPPAFEIGAGIQLEVR